MWKSAAHLKSQRSQLQVKLQPFIRKQSHLSFRICVKFLGGGDKMIKMALNDTEFITIIANPVLSTMYRAKELGHYRIDCGFCFQS